MNFIKAIPPKMLRDKVGLYQGGENRVGWQGEMDRCWIDNDANICVCSRLIRTQFGKIEHVTITKGQGTRNGEGEITWSQKQQIKNELFGEDRFAIEVFPKQKKLVDVMDVYHLWVFDKKLEMPFGIGKGEHVPVINRGYDFTEADAKRLGDDYKRTGKL